MDTYEGEYVNDKKCGKGIYTWSTSNVYEGEYFNDYRHGFGEMRWIDGSWYKGEWIQGKMSGKGELCSLGRYIKKGVFENNRQVTDVSQDYRSRKQF